MRRPATMAFSAHRKHVGGTSVAAAVYSAPSAAKRRSGEDMLVVPQPGGLDWANPEPTILASTDGLPLSRDGDGDEGDGDDGDEARAERRRAKMVLPRAK